MALLDHQNKGAILLYWHGVKVILYFLYSPVFQAHILYFRGKEKIPIFCINSPVFPIF